MAVPTHLQAEIVLGKPHCQANLAAKQLSLRASHLYEEILAAALEAAASSQAPGRTHTTNTMQALQLH